MNTNMAMASPSSPVTAIAARDFTARVNVGMVGVNVPIPVPIAYYTFGGWKGSAVGDLNQHGPDAFRFYTKTKTITSRWPSGHKRRCGTSSSRLCSSPPAVFSFARPRGLCPCGQHGQA